MPALFLLTHIVPVREGSMHFYSLGLTLLLYYNQIQPLSGHWGIWFRLCLRKLLGLRCLLTDIYQNFVLPGCSYLWLNISLPGLNIMLVLAMLIFYPPASLKDH